MARGLSCQVCRQRMSVKNERKQPEGSDVVYECKNDACSNYRRSGYRFSERVFEPK